MARGRLTVTAAGCALVAGAVATGPAALASATAAGDTRVLMPTMSWVTTGVRLGDDPDEARVHGRYRCSRAGADTTMRVSARQAPGIGSSGFGPESLAWYDAELHSFAADAGFAAVCDRRWREGRITVGHRLGELQRGPALVEYCLHDSDEEPLNSPGYTASCTLESVPVR